MLLSGLLGLAWLCCSSAQAVVSADAQGAGCTPVNNAPDISRALESSNNSRLDLCMSPAGAESPVWLDGHKPIAVQQGTDVQLDCAGRKIKSYNGNGRVTVSPQANLTLEECNWDSFKGASPLTGASDSDVSVLPGLEMDSQAHLLLTRSFIRMECAADGEVLDMSAINGAVSSITVAQAISTQLEDNKQASARTVIFAQIVATDLMSGEAMVMAEFRNVTLWCGPSWSLAKPTAIQALEAAEKKLDDIPSLGLAFNPMTVECTEDCPGDDDDEGHAEQLRNFVIGTFVLVCVVVLFVAAAFIYCIRRRRSSRREADVSNHYGSYQTSPQRRLWLKHKLLIGANNSRKALLNVDSSTEHRSKRSTVQLFSKGSGGSGSTESALGKPGVKDGSGMTSTYNGSRESHTKTTPGGSTCPLSSPGWAESRTSGGGVSGRSCMPAASTQNALFVCIETDEPQDDNACSTPLKKLFSNADGYTQHSMRASPSMVPSMVPASHNTNTAGAGASGSTCWAASGSEESSGTHMRRGVGSLRSEVANAVSQLQDALCSDLQDAQLKVFDVLGRGGFGTVYYGEWRGLSVAIKTLVFQSDSAADNQLQKVASEVAIASNLVHRNIVATYSHDVSPVTENGDELGIYKFYLIQEFCNGGSLRSAVGRGHFSSGHLLNRWEALMSVLQGIAAGMDYMHAKRICHGDLNPSNILFKYEPANDRTLTAALQRATAVCKIADFGMARRMQRNRSYASNVRQGTPFYISPETVNQHRLHRSSDVYAFGVIMWEMMRGVPVFVTRQKESDAGNISGTGQLEDSFQQHPDFPYLPASVPLTYTLTMKACLSERPDDRPSFAHLTVLLEDLLHEVAHGSYINSLGKMEASSAVQRVPDDEVMSDAKAESALEGSVGGHKSPGPGQRAVNGADMTTLSHALMGIEREGMATNPVSGSMPLSHSILLSGFKSTVQSLAATVPEPDGLENIDDESAPVQFNDEGAPLANLNAGVMSSSGLLTPANRSNSTPGQVQTTGGPLDRISRGSGTNGARTPTNARGAAAQGSTGVLSKVRHLRSGASSIWRSMGNSKQLGSEPSDRSAATAAAAANEIPTWRKNRAARTRSRPSNIASVEEGNEHECDHDALEADGAERRSVDRSKENNPLAPSQAKTNGNATHSEKMSPRPPLAGKPRANANQSAQQQQLRREREWQSGAEAISDTGGNNMCMPHLQVPAKFTVDCENFVPEPSPRTFDDTASAVLATRQESSVAFDVIDRQGSNLGLTNSPPSGRSSDERVCSPSPVSKCGSVTFDVRHHDFTLGNHAMLMEDGDLGITISNTQISNTQIESTLSDIVIPMGGEAGDCAQGPGVRVSNAHDHSSTRIAGTETISTQFTGWSGMIESSSMFEAAKSITVAHAALAGGNASLAGSRLADESSFVSARDSTFTPAARDSSTVESEVPMHAPPAVMVTGRRNSAAKRPFR